MGTYVESVISSGENVAYEAKISLWSMLPMFVIGLLLMPLLGIGLLFWLAAFIRYKSTELVITNKKIIAKFGFIRRDTIEMLLTKVESIQVRQSLLGRIMNYGSIIVSGAGNPQTPVLGISDPIQFRRRFMEIQEQSTK
jgi:uncharacterized membrane protein YdbT with pleckstrin-like domain